MQRRELITLLGIATAWSIAARAQQPAMPVVGFLSVRSPEESASSVAVFRRGLSESGYAEGQNVAIVFRWAEGQYDRLPALAADLVGRQVAVIVAAGGDRPALVFTSEVEAKKFALLRELVPKARLIAMMVNPNLPSANYQRRRGCSACCTA
jgi:putative tryptophan/tyrosine transport system substrate-binding protein